MENVPNCIICVTEILCPALTDPTDGTVVLSSGRSVNDEAFYSCNPGFVKTGGNLTRTCLDIGYWSGSAATCSEILCPDTFSPLNAIVVEVNNGVNGTIQYSCLSGFHNSAGNLSRTCMLDGVWSGDPPVCSEIFCPSLIPPQHGGLIQNTSVGGTAYCYCNPGFQLSGGDSNLTCLDNGTWDGDPVICSEILCPVIENPENGIVTLSNNISMTNIGMSGVPFNTIATFSCNPGYYIAASVSIFKRICLVNGSWDGAPFSCSEILCPELDEAPNSTITHINRSINGTVRYKCNKGYILANGSLQRKCTSYGEWDGKPPNCTALGQCMCPCNMVHEPKYTNTSDKALIREIEKMREELLVLETAAALRKKISVKDFRPSTNASGSVWVILLLIMAALIIVPDVLSALRHVKIVCTRRLISREIK
ncbi:CUB and sushi domain-containing protein 3-like [Saccostrea echinata]|uniref:CUB and sushi domain-containing protein 3-like n=1 Tax=Saccostrea echinata TaxID=191078 RepID=UPI002A7FC0FF|nr:CUB and sushi domain-containing protein 3-like [Saccostrea echinata]